ncbi:phosphonate metabolism protein/1,5-bisphosphokinase (PRPP-forming) PhnN [Ottowia caeni]|uniref:phosphonate metabolism protein/1,5-bisphosphokinase (PRPP-forming) PhnN n=1 Tax=Ottowia caeni TaxID=2870339 RepID=UPI001E2F252F|nr:phosphonate metabolism protein/1,5-bisphosphokinase (PRPP-forming) PhnN [Ottowia caeni]
MSDRLVYVIGPSGAGKDSVLQGLRQVWPAAAPAHWARRSITRPATSGGEHHEALEDSSFEQQRQANAFAMHWKANGLSYGIRHSELQPLDFGHWVFVNGSRSWLPELLARWPEATVVHIGAAPAVLAQRLSARGRETAESVAARLGRQVHLDLPVDSIRIDNNGVLETAVAELQQALRDRSADAMLSE